MKRTIKNVGEGVYVSSSVSPSSKQYYRQYSFYYMYVPGKKQENYAIVGSKNAVN